MNKVAGRAGIILILALFLLGGLSFFVFEFVVEADDWIVFPGSPHVYNGGNIGCGVITDREGALLLDLSGSRTYATDESLRKSVIHWVGDRKGSISAPAPSTYANELAGYNLLNGVYTYGNTGGVAELTLSAQAQVAALKAMGNYKGTIGVYNYKTGQLLCVVTTPTYDPDNIPDLDSDDSKQYEGMYVNRFTQSVYTPGSIFKIVTLAAVFEAMPQIEEQTFSCTGSYQIGTGKITCEYKHGKQSLKEAFRNSCNVAFAVVAQQLGAETLERYVKQFKVAECISFDGITTASGSFTSATLSELDMAWSSIGQYKDQVNACVFMNFVGAIGAGGKGVMPYLVDTVGTGAITSYRAKTQKAERIMSETTAQKLQEYMGFNVTDKYGSDNFPGMTVCAKTGTAEVGGGKKPNAMIAGFVSDEEYPLAFVVAVEDAGYGRDVCVPILSKVLTVCKEVLDR